MTEHNFHAITGPNGMCECCVRPDGTMVTCGELLDEYVRAQSEAAAQQERARLADIFNTTETDVWRAHEVRDFLLSQNMAHPPPTPEGK